MCVSCNEAQREFILYATHSLTSLCLPFLLWSAHHMLHITVKLLICRPPCCVQLLHHRPGLISASHRLYPTTTTTRVACVNNSFAYNMMSSPWGLIRVSSSLCTLRVNICSLLPKSFSLTCFSMLSRNIRVAKRSFNLLHDCFFLFYWVSFGTVFAALFLLSWLESIQSGENQNRFLFWLTCC